MLRLLRRQTRDAAPDEDTREEVTQPAILPEGRLDTEAVDALEADVLKAIRGVTLAIAEAAADVAAVEKDLAAIRSHAADLAASGQAASGQTVSLASATEELAVTSADIGRAMDHASARIDEAVQTAQRAAGLIAQLSSATAEIVGIVDTISAVARQTNLLALNATIEAARAGEAGKGFGVVASEVKALSVQTSNAADDIRTRIAHLRDTADTSTAAVSEVVASIQGVQPVFDTVRSAVGEQDAAITEVARLANATSGTVSQVGERAGEVDKVSLDASDLARQADLATKQADSLARALGQRFVTAIRQSEIGDRRKADRFPVDRPVSIVAGGRKHSSRTIDVSTGGVLLGSIADSAVGAGANLEIDAPGMGQVRARVVAASDMGLHCAFIDLDSDARARIDRFVAEIEQNYRPLILLAQQTAHKVEAVIEKAIQDGAISREAAFDTDYKPIAGTNPVQYSTAYLPVFERILPAILEPVLASDPKMAFCLALDRNGYIPVHNKAYSHLQRPEDPVWNAANSRNKRIFDDRAGITAARSTRPFVVQAYARDMGGGKVVLMQEVDAPIRVLGRHWGGLRTAYRL